MSATGIGRSLTDRDVHPNACAILEMMPISVKHLERLKTGFNGILAVCQCLDAGMHGAIRRDQFFCKVCLEHTSGYDCADKPSRAGSQNTFRDPKYAP